MLAVTDIAVFKESCDSGNPSGHCLHLRDLINCTFPQPTLLFDTGDILVHVVAKLPSLLQVAGKGYGLSGQR